MSRQSLTSILSIAVLAAMPLPLPAADVALTVQSDNVVNTIHPHVYGHFFEHIYHSANNGIWGEVVWNRSFEQGRENAMGSIGWHRQGGLVRYTGSEPQSRITGAFEYRDFDYTVKARKTEGDGGLRLTFRGNTALTIGAQGNTVHVLEAVTAGRGGRGGETIAAQGWMGVGVVGAKAEFRNFLIRGLDGQIFWNEPLYTNVADASPLECWGVSGGTPQVIRDPAQALNDEQCLQLTSAAVAVAATLAGNRIAFTLPPNSVGVVQVNR